jgi:hypothetical protein
MIAIERRFMMEMKIRDYIKYAIAGLSVMALASGCAYFEKVIKSEQVNGIPDKKYEKIIRLDTPDGMPLKPDAGFVYVEPEGKVTTDFAREIFVKNLDGLDKYEQINRNNMGKFVIKDSKGKVRGYYEILPEYRAHIWERGDDILLQVVIPDKIGIKSDGDGMVGVGGLMPGGGGR